MASLPTPTKIAGSYLSVYESYYKLVDPNNQGHVGPKEAADFLKKSQLNESLLIKIWDMADPHSRGFLDKAGMMVALKLCALAQQGHDLTIANIYMDIPPPKMGDASSLSSFWTITSSEREKYQLLFQSLEPTSGYVSGIKVKGILMDSKLPLETLGKIWDLADMDRDGRLNRHEFFVAMHLVCKAVQKYPIPNALPIELLDSNRTLLTDPMPRKQSSSSSTGGTTIISEKESKVDWIVSMDDQKAADKLFVQADKDLDGFVSGAEIKDIFIQSGLPQAILAHIWGLCDISQNGKLNNEQFALSMWLIKQKLSNKELPTKLTNEMIPPSFKKNILKKNEDNNNVCNSSYSNPELDMINKDIIEIIREKHTLEQDISQKEADIKIKSGEIKSLQSELDTLAATLRQLDSQKGEAQKRLNDLKAQVDKLRQQADDQESTLRVQEDDLSAKRQEIESLRMTEQNLEAQQNDCKNKLNSLSNDLQNTQLKFSQTRAQMTQLEEQQHQILDAITQYDAAINSNDITKIPEALYYLKIDLSAYKLSNNKDDNEETINKDTFNNNNQEIKNSGFETSFCQNNNFDNKGGFENDAPFQQQQQQQKDPFNEKSYDPFNDGISSKNSSNFETTTLMKDPFGEDPFAALHAPVRSESSSPALPAKQSKKPPPRPAPPKSIGAKNNTTLSSSSIIINTSDDPFAEKTNNPSSGGDGFGFANFANFEGK